MIDGPVAPAASTRLAERPLPLDAVRLRPEGVLGAWQERNRRATIPHAIARLEQSGALPNMRRATGESAEPFRGFPFSDSDIYKVLEAIGWEAARSDVSDLLPFVDETVDLLARAQRDDGYLNSFYQSVHPELILADLRWGHELYCLGHLLQAGIAWARTTGRRDLLEIGLRFTVLIDERFGDDGDPVVCGHPEIETALVELHRLTGETAHLRLAQLFIDRRGRRTVGEDRFGYHYFQDHEPIRSAADATGHAVRQLYLAAGAADLAAELPTCDVELEDALDRIWTSAFTEKQYITGGLGSRHRDEAFGDPFELPPDRAYAETCAAIAGFQFSWRMLLATGEARFADEMERALYNAIAESTSADGTGFFYSSPLQIRTRRDGVHEQAPSDRAPWYDCACCPPNLARLVSALSAGIASVAGDRLRVHLLADAEIDLGAAGALSVRTAYPWDGAVEFVFDEPFTGVLEIRLPGWVRETDAVAAVSLAVDGAAIAVEPDERGYLVIDGRAAAVREARLDLPMHPVVRHPHPHIDAVRGSVAVTRGPIVYCVEQQDLPAGIVMEDVVVDAASVPIDTEARPFDGAWAAPVVRMTGRTRRIAASAPYPVAEASVADEDLDVELVPYALWGNRTAGPMRVWLPTA